MEFTYRYYGNSTIENTSSQTSIRFAPDTLRAPVFFNGDINRHIPFREAMCALHEVVVSDLRVQPKDRSAYFAWLKEQESVMLADFMAQGPVLQKRVRELETELLDLRREKNRVLEPFERARRHYFDYLYKMNRDAWFVLDPVVTVHPDSVFFECFSRDESSYANLSCSHNIFKQMGEFSCGTTNVDYSSGLFEEFLKIRSYKTTQLTVENSGFTVQTDDDPAFVEEKIDLPNSWVRGFLQVSSAMNLPAYTVQLHPMDVHNLCFILRRRKELHGPRSIRFIFEPGAPLRLLFEPWNQEIICRHSIFYGSQPGEVRVWGRRRLLILEKLIAVSDRFTVHLLGNGLPSFWIAEMPDMKFTLGLSGWTANDWSRAGQFDLLAPRRAVSDAEQLLVYRTLAQRWMATTDELTRATDLPRSIVFGALTLLVQGGRVIYDLSAGLYRLRELTREPLSLSQLRFANEREIEAEHLLASQTVAVTEDWLDTGGRQLSATLVDATGYALDVALKLDVDERLVDASCQCGFFIRNRLRRGPCAHVLALRMAQAGKWRTEMYKQFIEGSRSC